MFRLRLDEELELHLLEARHAGELYALVDANRAHLSRWFDWPADTTDASVSRSVIVAGLRRFARGDGFAPAGLRERGRLVGTMGLHYVRAGATELGYWLAEDAQGRGLMTRAVRGLLPHLFEDLDLHRVEIRADPRNARSRAVPERLGFREEGTLRGVTFLHGARGDHVVYSLLRDEWRAAQAEGRG